MELVGTLNGLRTWDTVIGGDDDCEADETFCSALDLGPGLAPTPWFCICDGDENDDVILNGDALSACTLLGEPSSISTPEPDSLIR